MNPILAGLIGPLIDKVASFIPNPEERQKARLALEAQVMQQQSEIVKALIASDAQQNEINKIEAASSSMFIAGWRPYIGWVCGFALSWQYVLMPIATWVASVVASSTGGKALTFPVLDNSQLYPILLALLGMGGLRTLEKIQGVARESRPGSS